MQKLFRIFVTLKKDLDFTKSPKAPNKKADINPAIYGKLDRNPVVAKLNPNI